MRNTKINAVKQKSSSKTSKKRKHQEALIDEASRESFPASDPPAFMATKHK